MWLGFTTGGPARAEEFTASATSSPRSILLWARIGTLRVQWLGMVRTAAGLVAVMLVLGSCIGGGTAEAEDEGVATSVGPAPNGAEQAPAASEPGRLVVLGADGLHLRDSDGTNDVLLAGPDVRPSSPAFSADGAYLAWSQVNDLGQFELAVAAVDNPSEQSTSDSPISAFYLSWSPDSSHIAALGNAPGGVGLAVAAVGGGMVDVPELVITDQPLYFSWSSSSDQFLTHTSAGSGVVDLDGLRQQVLAEVGQYQAPIWLRDGRMLLVEPGNDHEVVTLVDGDIGTELASVPGGALLVADPRGERVAIVSRNQTDTAPNIINVGFQAVPTVGSGVAVVDLVTGAVETVTLERRWLASFSPDGSSLLTLSVTDRLGGGRWDIWSDGRSIASIPFAPSRLTAATRFPFYDQFVQAGTRWAPDGASFAFARSVAGSAAGEIVRYDVASGETTVIGSGRLVLWRP